MRIVSNVQDAHARSVHIIKRKASMCKMLKHFLHKSTRDVQDSVLSLREMTHRETVII